MSAESLASGETLPEISAYLARFPEETRQRLQTLRDLVREVAPDAKESISYGLLAYKLQKKPLIYFGGFAQHIGMYATPVGHEAFAAEFAGYRQGKGSVRFPFGDPLPIDLITRVVRFRVATLTE